MRKTYLDNIRWITVFIVFVFHVIYMFNGIVTSGVLGPFSDVQYQDIFQYIVYPWFMLLLFVVSGMSARYSLEKRTAKEFIAMATRKYLVPATLGTLVFWWILGYYNMQIAGGYEQTIGKVPGVVFFLIMAVSGTGVLWYIQMLWAFSLLLIVVRKVEKDKLYNLTVKAGLPLLLALMPVIWGAAQILNTPMIVVYRFGIYGAGYFIGYFVFSHDQVMERLEKFWLPMTIATIVCCFINLFSNYGKVFADHEVLDTFSCNLYAWIAVLGILSFMKKWGDFSNSFSSWMSSKSWGIYLFHYLGIAVPAYYIRRAGLGIPPVFVYLICAFSGFFGAILLYEIISRIPILRWFVLGMKGEKKDVRRESYRATKA